MKTEEQMKTLAQRTLKWRVSELAKDEAKGKGGEMEKKSHQEFKKALGAMRTQADVVLSKSVQP